MPEYSDKQLITDYLKGNEKALEILIQQYLKPIYGFVFRYTGNTQESEDIIQEVFVKVWKNLKKFDQQKNFKAWIFSIAKNTAIDFLRKKKTIPFSAFENEDGENALIETLADSAPLPPEIFDRQNLAQELADALEKLSPQYRLALLLHYNDHLTFREIAEILNEPLHTIKSRHRRGLIMLRKLL